MKRTVLPTFLFCVTLLLAACAPGWCWDKFGHMAISQIAYDKLTPVAKAHVDSLIAVLDDDPDVTGLPPAESKYNGATVGAWMDDLRSLTPVYNTWHYIDMPWLPKAAASDVEAFAASQSADDTNAYDVIVRQCLPTLNSATAADTDKARMLGFLFHLVGDIHQPLHAIGLDRGGNTYAIDPLPDFDPSWHIVNLHAFWDNAYRYDSRRGKVAVVESQPDLPRPSRPDTGEVKAFATRLTAKYLTRDKAQLTDTGPADWVAESTRDACMFAFPADNSHTLSADYVHKAHDMACGRLALAGYRLGSLLNSIFDPSSSPAKAH